MNPPGMGPMGMMGGPMGSMGDDGGNTTGIPMFNKNGTALSQDERKKMAHRKGVCLQCGTKTHEIKFRRIPISNKQVFNGICIRCNPTRVPPEVYQKWEEEDKHKPLDRFRAAAHVTAYAVSHKPKPQAPAPAVSQIQRGQSAAVRPASGGTRGSRAALSRTVGPGGGAQGAASLLASIPTEQTRSGRSQNSAYTNSSGDGDSLDGSSLDMSLEANKSASGRSLHSEGSAGESGKGHLSLLKPKSKREAPKKKFSSRGDITQSERGLTDSASKLGFNQQSSLSLSERSGERSTRFPARSPSYDSTASGLGGNVSSRNALSSRESIGPSRESGARTKEDYTGGGADASEGIWDIAKDLHDNRDDPDFLRVKLHQLRNLQVQNDPTGAVHDIKDIMDEYRDDSRFLAVACGALWGLTAFDDDKKSEAAEAGAVDTIVDALRNPRIKDDDEFFQWGVGTITCLARGYDNKALIANSGGIDTLLGALRSQKDLPAVFEWACRALHALVYQYDDEGDEEDSRVTYKAIQKNMTSIDEAEGVGTIMEAMAQHPQEAIAQRWAVMLLLRLLDRESDHDVGRMWRRMKKADGIGVCAKILKARSTTPGVFAWTLELIFNMIVEAGKLDQKTNEVIGDCIPAISRAMKENKDLEMLQEGACRLLSRVAGAARLQITECEITDSVVKAMAAYPTNASLQESASWFLWTLSFVPAFFDYSLVGDTMEALKQSTDAFPESAVLLAGACGFIANISLAPETDMSHITMDIPVSALQSKAKGSLQSVVYAQACRAFANICRQVPETADQLVGSHHVNSIIERLKGASDSSVGAECGILVAIAGTSEKNREFLLQAGCIDASLNVMNTTSSSIAAASALELLSALVGSSKENLPRDLVSRIVSSLQDGGVDREDNQASACRILTGIVLTISSKDMPDLEGLAGYMVEVLNSENKSAVFKQGACEVLWAMTVSRQQDSTLVLENVFRSIVVAMADHRGEDKEKPYAPDLQSSAAGALFAVSTEMKQSSFKVSCEEMESIVSVVYMVLENDATRKDLLEKFLKVVSNICKVDDEVIVQSGGIVMAIDVMAENAEHEGIQEEGCEFLALLASKDNLQVNLCISDTGGIESLLSALAKFPKNDAIQTYACKALSHLSADNESRFTMLEQDGLHLIVTLINGNRDNVLLLDGACSVLLNLSAIADDEAIMSSKALESILILMRHHEDVDSLHESGLGVLQNISMRSAESKQAVAAAGGIDSVLTTFREFMGSPKVLERAFTTLWSLCVLEHNQVEVGSKGDAIDLLLNCMMANLDDATVQKQACGCLCTLATNSDNKNTIRDAGGADAAVFAMHAHYASEAVQTAASQLMASLAVNVQTNEVMLAGESEVSCIISAMRHYPEAEKLQEHCCCALRNFMMSGDNVDLIANFEDVLAGLLTMAASQFTGCLEPANQILACF